MEREIYVGETQDFETWGGKKGSGMRSNIFTSQVILALQALLAL